MMRALCLILLPTLANALISLCHGDHTGESCHVFSCRGANTCCNKAGLNKCRCKSSEYSVCPGTQDCQKNVATQCDGARAAVAVRLVEGEHHPKGCDEIEGAHDCVANPCDWVDGKCHWPHGSRHSHEHEEGCKGHKSGEACVADNCNWKDGECEDIDCGAFHKDGESCVKHGCNWEDEECHGKGKHHKHKHHKHHKHHDWHSEHEEFEHHVDAGPGPVHGTDITHGNHDITAAKAARALGLPGHVEEDKCHRDTDKTECVHAGCNYINGECSEVSGSWACKRHGDGESCVVEGCNWKGGKCYSAHKGKAKKSKAHKKHSCHNSKHAVHCVANGCSFINGKCREAGEMDNSDCEHKDAKTCVTTGCAWKDGKCFYNRHEHEEHHAAGFHEEHHFVNIRAAVESSPVLAPAGVLAAAAIGGIVVAAAAMRRRNQNEVADPVPYGTL